jgi:hypothetical protein
MTRIARRDLLLLCAGLAITSSLWAADADRYQDPDLLYAALRDQPGNALHFGPSTVNIVFADGATGLDRGPVLAWVRGAAAALSGYFGRFPVADYKLLVIAEPSDRIGHATTYGYDGPATRIHVGTKATEAAFARDWVLVHEMLHAALPNLPRRALWLQEGNATYVEPIARARAGQLPSAEIWSQLVVGLPKGERGPDQGSIDGTQDWGRLYWGGAMFWLLAEVAIFEQSRGRHMLRDALRAINRLSGGNAVIWSPEQMMQTGDIATGTRALSDLYARFAAGAVVTDLPALFTRLGVAPTASNALRFDDHAPLSTLRRAMTGDLRLSKNGT